MVLECRFNILNKSNKSNYFANYFFLYILAIHLIYKNICMIYNEINKVVTSVEQYRGASTLYELKWSPIENNNDKMSLVIRLLRLIKGIWYWGIIKAENQKSMDMKEYKQALSTCLTYNNRTEFVVGWLVKMMIELVWDLNMSLNSKPNYDLLRSLIKKEIDLKEFQDYNEFFSNELTSAEKESIDRRKLNNEITGQSDLDWKSMSFILDTTEWQVVISDRQSFMKLKMVDLEKAIPPEFSKWWFDKELEYIFMNISLLKPQAKMAMYRLLLTALLFRQEYSKYPWLVRSKEEIDLKLDSNN